MIRRSADLFIWPALLLSGLKVISINFRKAYLSGDDINRYVEDLGYLQDRVDMSACSGCEVMGRAALAPAGHEFSCTAGEAGSHVGISEGEDLSFLVDAFCCDEFEVAVAILCDGKVCDRSGVGIELCQISAACFAVEDFYDLHGRLLAGNICIAGSAVSDDGYIVVEVDRVHFRQLAGS